VTKAIGRGCALGLAALLSACQPVDSNAPPSEAERNHIEQQVQQYFKKAANLPEGVTLKLNNLAPAQVPGLLAGELEASNGTNTQKVPLMVSRDGRYLVQGHLTDLTVDPYKAVMEKIDLKERPMRGNPSATVTIVEYSDFQCPFCSRAYATVEDEVMKNYADKVRLVFKHFPLPMHPWAESGALASECVRQQKPEAFWKLYDFLFKSQQDITLENLKEKAQGVVREAGLDVGAFDNCFDNKTALPAVTADMKEAEALGVNSTPTFFINGRKLEGAVPYANFQSTINQALAPGGA
jgi:protein-disulfide isomerase